MSGRFRWGLHMPDMARHVASGEEYCATEVPYIEGLGPHGWECPVCQVEMIAVAADGARVYKVAPHFRAEGNHRQDCDADGKRRMVTTGAVHVVRDANGPPADYPNQLVLAAQRPQVAPADGGPDGVPPAANINRYRGAGEGIRGQHAHYARTLHRIVEFYVGHPEERQRRLTIPNVDGVTYHNCFWEIRGVTEETRFPPKVLYAQIAFKRFEQDENSLTVFLNPAFFVANPDPREAEEKPRIARGKFRVRFDMTGWSTRRRNAFLSTAEVARQQQRDLHGNQDSAAVRLYFIGRQDAADFLLFHVTDPRLACFFVS